MRGWAGRAPSIKVRALGGPGWPRPIDKSEGFGEAGPAQALSIKVRGLGLGLGNRSDGSGGRAGPARLARNIPVTWSVCCKHMNEFDDLQCKHAWTQTMEKTVPWCFRGAHSDKNKLRMEPIVNIEHMRDSQNDWG